MNVLHVHVVYFPEGFVLNCIQRVTLPENNARTT